MKYNLFLDDMRWPKDAFLYTGNLMYLDLEWHTVMNYKAFVTAIEDRGVPDVVSFDHDLAEEHYGMQDNIEYGLMKEKTGFHCAEWLIYHCIDNDKPLPRIILIHSMNPAGSQNIKSLFKTYEKIYGKHG